ncbi:hypothetical protein ACLKA7_005048 [Drosophila subpalustris]
MCSQRGRYYKWIPQQQLSGRGRDLGWRQFGPPPAYGSCRCHQVCGKCCEGWEAAPPAAAPPAAAPRAAAPPAAAQPAAAPPGWVRSEDLRAQAAIQPWVPLDCDANVPPSQPRTVVQWIPFRNVPPTNQKIKMFDN